MIFQEEKMALGFLGLPLTVIWFGVLFGGVFAIRKSPELRKWVVALLIAIPTLFIAASLLVS